MSGKWASSNRRDELPHNWQQVRDEVRRRAGGQCETITDGNRCPNKGTDCDHINDRNDHRSEACQWICGAHHALKTGEEATAALRALNAKLAHPATRSVHPGLR